MFAYDVQIALRSLRRHPVLTAIVVATIGLGVGVAATFSTARHSLAKDPIPHKSQRLYYVRLDSWDPQKAYPGDDPTRPPTQITYQDMTAITRATQPVRQSPMFKARLNVQGPGDPRPRREFVRLVRSDFFTMFDLPFRHGTPWARSADQGPEPVVVLSSEANDTLFGGRDSVGQTIRVDGREFRVVGVLDRFRPSVKFYDVTQNSSQAPEPIYMPFDWVVPMEIRTAGNSDGWGVQPQPGFAGFLAAETCWIQMWVELENEAALASYRSFLDAHATEQRARGRFQRPLNNRVTPLTAWLDEQGVVPPQVTAMAVVSLLFLATCALNLTGLLLGKFMARAPEVGVRRALGASRANVFVQHLVECELAALGGGLLGLLLAIGGVALLNNWAKTIAQRGDLLQLDLSMVALGVVLALLAGLIAGAYPSWRVCRVAPARYLKAL